MRTKTVLCAVDVSNSDVDIGVLRKAQEMANLEEAQLDVITVVPDYGMSVVGQFFDDSHHEKVVAEAQARLASLVTEALGAKANKEARHIVATGNAYEAILKAADADDANLIVIGAHKPEFADYLLGPNAARVVRHSKCSVFVVRD